MSSANYPSDTQREVDAALAELKANREKRAKARVYPPAPVEEKLSISLGSAELAASALVTLKKSLEADLAAKWDKADSFERCQRSQEIARLDYAITEIGPAAAAARERHIEAAQRWRDQRGLVGRHQCGDGRFLCPECGPAGLDHVVCRCGGEISFWRDIIDPGHCDACLDRARAAHDAEFPGRVVGRVSSSEVA